MFLLTEGFECYIGFRLNMTHREHTVPKAKATESKATPLLRFLLGCGVCRRRDLSVRRHGMLIVAKV